MVAKQKYGMILGYLPSPKPLESSLIWVVDLRVGKQLPQNANLPQDHDNLPQNANYHSSSNFVSHMTWKLLWKTLFMPKIRKILEGMH